MHQSAHPADQTPAVDPAAAETAEANRVLMFEAIARRVCIDVVYNRMTMRLAPHILYTRHGDLFIDAVTLSRDGQPPREIKIGMFKLSGLRDVAVSDAPFVPQTLFDPNDVKYRGVTLFAV